MDGTLAKILFNLANTLINILYLLLFAHIILSWIRTINSTIWQIADAVDKLVNPMLSPLRRIVPTVDLGGIALDLSVLVAFVLLGIIRATLLPLILAIPI